MIRVFAQGPAALDLPRLLGAARAHFEASVEVESAAAPPVVHSAVLRVTSARHGYSGRYEVRARGAVERDYAEADAAEERGRAAGMASLARRCPSLFELTPGDLTDPGALNLCAIIASVSLGPALPPDGSTLLGVRSSMERLERLLGARSLLR